MRCVIGAVRAFTSHALLQVLEGVEQLVAATPDGRGHGQMRLITGVFLSSQDVAAIARGAPVEQVLSDHLVRKFPFRHVESGGEDDGALGAELLAWLVDHGHPEIRVALPLHNGQVANDGASFHVKEDIIEDRPGQRLAFTGSVNETPNGWSSNDESFTTFCSWQAGGEEHIDDFEAGFLHLWQNQDPGARTFTLPDAVRRELAIFQSTEGLPRRLKLHIKAPSPAEGQPEPTPVAPSDIDERHGRVARRLKLHVKLHVKVPPSAEDQPEPTPVALSDIDERRRVVWNYVLHSAARDLPGSERVGEATAPSPHGPTSTGPFSGSGKVAAPTADRRRGGSGQNGASRSAAAPGLVEWQGATHPGDGASFHPQAVAAGTAGEVRPRLAHLHRQGSGVAGHTRATWWHVPAGGRLRLDDGTLPTGLQSSAAAPGSATGGVGGGAMGSGGAGEAHHARTRRDASGRGVERHRPNTMMQLMQQLRSRSRGLLLLTATPLQVSSWRCGICCICRVCPRNAPAMDGGDLHPLFPMGGAGEPGRCHPGRALAKHCGAFWRGAFLSLAGDLVQLLPQAPQGVVRPGGSGSPLPPPPGH